MDGHLRQLERRSASSVEHRVSLIHARVRSGLVRVEALRVAALLDPVAGAVYDALVPAPEAVRPDGSRLGWPEHLVRAWCSSRTPEPLPWVNPKTKKPENMDFLVWNDFVRLLPEDAWGTEACVRLSFTAATLVRPEEREQPLGGAIEAWIACPCDTHAGAVRSLQDDDGDVGDGEEALLPYVALPLVVPGVPTRIASAGFARAAALAPRWELLEALRARVVPWLLGDGGDEAPAAATLSPRR